MVFRQPNRLILLVEEYKRNAFVTEFIAWTGSHRILAARLAQLPTVPCKVITDEEASTAFSRVGYDVDGYGSWRSAITAREGRYDAGRLRALEKAGLDEAARMLRDEIARTKADPSR